MDLEESTSATMAKKAETGAAAAVMTEDTHGMTEVATTKVAEDTAVGASTMTITIAVTAKGTDVNTRLAEARGTESPRTVLHRHLLARAEAAAVAESQGLPPPMAERSETHETC